MSLHAITHYEVSNLSVGGSSYQIRSINSGILLAITETIMSSNQIRVLILKVGTLSVNYPPNKIRNGYHPPVNIDEIS
jgi:hypothetical protein